MAILGHQQIQCAHPGAQSPWLIAVTLPSASFDALVRGSAAYVLGHLGFQNLLHHPLGDLAKKVGSSSKRISCAICVSNLR